MEAEKIYTNLTREELSVMSDAELLSITGILEEIIDTKMDEFFSALAKDPKSINFADVDKVAEEERNVCSMISQIKRLRRPTWKMDPLPTYGDHMTLKKFISCVKSGGFINYDGFGQYASKTQISDITILPSDIHADAYRKDFSHIVWFNR